MNNRISELQPRQLEPDLATQRSPRKRTAQDAVAHDEPNAQQAASGDQNQAKKPRSNIPRAPNPSRIPGAPTAADEPVEKPDVFEYLAQRANRQKELESEVQKLSEQERSLADKLKTAELQISSMKTEAAAEAARHKASTEQLELQLKKMEAQLQREAQRSTEAEVALKRQKSATPTPPPATTAAGTPTLAEAQRAARELHLKVSELELQLEMQATEAEEAASRAKQALNQERQRREAETASVALLQQQVNDAAAALEAQATARREAETRCAELESQLSKAETGAGASRSSEGDAVLIKTLRERLAVAEVEAAEAHKLKEQVTNAHVLRERLQSAEAKAKRAEQLALDAEELHEKLASAEESVRRWELVLSGAADCTSPEDVIHLLKKLQEDQLAAVAATGDRSTTEAALRAQLEAAEEAGQQASIKEAALKAAADQAADALARAERQVALLTKERDGLKAIVDSYDQEYLVHHAPGGESSPDKKRITELESTIESLHSHIAALEKDMSNIPKPQVDTAAIAEANAKAEAAEARLKRTEQEAAGLVEQLTVLQSRLAKGEFDPEKTRVLHFKVNPEAEAHRIAVEQRIAELESENEALKENLERFEKATDGGAQLGDSGLRVAQLEGELNLLRRKVAETRKASDRLQQVFTKQIALFRESMAALFGYKVEMTVDPASKEHKAQFLLRPHNADEPGAELSFYMLRDGRMVHIPTEYSRRKLKVEVETFVERFRSIPAFTANLTMELFQRQTQN